MQYPSIKTPKYLMKPICCWSPAGVCCIQSNDSGLWLPEASWRPVAPSARVATVNASPSYCAIRWVWIPGQHQPNLHWQEQPLSQRSRQLDRPSAPPQPKRDLRGSWDALLPLQPPPPLCQLWPAFPQHKATETPCFHSLHKDPWLRTQNCWIFTDLNLVWPCTIAK